MPKPKIATLIAVSIERTILLLSYMNTPPYSQKKAKFRAKINPKAMIRQDAITSLSLIIVSLTFISWKRGLNWFKSRSSTSKKSRLCSSEAQSPKRPDRTQEIVIYECQYDCDYYLYCDNRSVLGVSLYLGISVLYRQLLIVYRAQGLLVLPSTFGLVMNCRPTGC